MGIEVVTGRVPPDIALRQEIAKRRTSAAVVMSGMGPVLDILDAYVAAIGSEMRDLRHKVKTLEGGK
jgi:hypothetical protein